VISVDTALDNILSRIQPLGIEERSLLESLGMVLAENVYSVIDVPPKDNSALDGYALLAADIKGAGPDKPCFLKVVDMVVAGGTPRIKVESGTAVRIMTGAPTPEGADCVVGFENTDETERSVSHGKIPVEIGILREESSGANIRKAGESIKKRRYGNNLGGYYPSFRNWCSSIDWSGQGQGRPPSGGSRSGYW